MSGRCSNKGFGANPSTSSTVKPPIFSKAAHTRAGRMTLRNSSNEKTPATIYQANVLLFNTCLDYHFTHIVTKPTRIGPTSANIIDFILTTAPDVVRHFIFLSGLSHLCFIHFTLEARVPRRLLHLKTIKNYAKEHYTSIKAELESFFHTYDIDFCKGNVENNCYML